MADLHDGRPYTPIRSSQGGKAVAIMDAALYVVSQGKMTSLHLANRGLGDEECWELQRALAKNAVITKVDLASNSIGDGGAAALAELLTTNTRIEVLDLSNRSLGEDGERVGSNKITSAGALALASTLDGHQNRTLKVLDLTGNKIGDQGAFALATALKANLTLIDMFVGSNAIGPVGADALNWASSRFRCHGHFDNQDFNESKAEIATAPAKKSALSVEERIRRLSPLSRFPRQGKIKMTLEGTLDTIYECWEKKCIADEADAGAGTTPDALVDFLLDFFTQKYGVKKMAEQKLGDFVICLIHYQKEHRRISPYLQMIGLQDEGLFSRLPGDLMSSLLARAFKGQLQSIKEQLDEDPDYVQPDCAVDMVIGSDAKRKDAAAWACPVLRKLATTPQIDALLKEIEGLPQTGSKVDLDDVVETVLRRFISWCQAATDTLAAAWERAAKPSTTAAAAAGGGGGGGGKIVDVDDFATIMRDVCDRRDLAQDDALKAKTWAALKANLGYEDSDSGIEHGTLFAVGCVQLGLVPQV